MNKREWKKLTREQKLAYAIKNAKDFCFVIDGGFLNIEHPTLSTIADFGVTDLLKYLSISYEDV